MLKHGNELDDLIDAQSRAGLRYSGTIRNGKLPYGARQLLKNPKKAAILYLLLLPGILVVVASSLSRLLEDFGDTGALVTGIVTALVAVVYLLVIANAIKKAKQAKKAVQSRKKQQRRKKKRR
jgi:hypothetical protein